MYEGRRTNILGVCFLGEESVNAISIRTLEDYVLRSESEYL